MSDTGLNILRKEHDLDVSDIKPVTLLFLKRGGREVLWSESDFLPQLKVSAETWSEIVISAKLNMTLCFCWPLVKIK